LDYFIKDIIVLSLTQTKKAYAMLNIKINALLFTKVTTKQSIKKKKIIT